MMKRRVLTLSPPVLGATTLLAVLAVSAGAGDLPAGNMFGDPEPGVAASMARTAHVGTSLRLTQLMSGEGGAGSGAVFPMDRGDGKRGGALLEGVLCDGDGQRVLWIEFGMGQGSFQKHWSNPENGTGEGYLWGEIRLMGDASGEQGSGEEESGELGEDQGELVGIVRGEWYETSSGIGVLEAVILDGPVDSRGRATAGILEGTFLLGRQVEDVENGDAPSGTSPATRSTRKVEPAGRFDLRWKVFD